MSVDSSLAISATGTAPGSAKGTAATLAGTEAFADVMAGVTSTPDQQVDGVGTGANLRFNVAPAEVAVEGMAKAGVQPAEPAVPDLALVTLTGGKNQPRLAKQANDAMQAGSGETPVLMAQSDPTVDAKPRVRRERATDDDLSEAAPATPAGPPAAIIPITVAPVATTPEPAARPLAVKGRGISSVTGNTTPSAPVSSLVSILTDQAGTAGTATQGQTLPGTTSDSRQAPEPVPARLTAVADIVQNLPPLIQSQVGALGPVPTAAIGPATDVGATLSGEAIDMGVGGQWIDRVAREITALAQGSGHSRFQLNPPNLGRLQIDVWHGEGGGRVQLLTETDEAAMRLRQDQASLQADARLSALSLDRIVIDRAPGAFGASPDHGANTGAGRHDTSDRGTSQSNSQTGQQPAAQQGNNSGSAAGQGKAPQRRDVFNEHTQPDGQEGRASAPADGRHVRYA